MIRHNMHEHHSAVVTAILPEEAKGIGIIDEHDHIMYRPSRSNRRRLIRCVELAVFSTIAWFVTLLYLGKLSLVFRESRVLLAVDYSYSPVTPTWHPFARKDRFPSVEERVKIYMSFDWYDPAWRRDREYNASIPVLEYAFQHSKYPTSDMQVWQDLVLFADEQQDKEEASSNLLLTNIVRNADVFFADPQVMIDCARPPVQSYFNSKSTILPTNSDSRIFKRTRSYCEDIVNMFDIKKDLDDMHTPVLTQFGDSPIHYSQIRQFHLSVPIFLKYRLAQDAERHKKYAFPPILWPLQYDRHFVLPIEELGDCAGTAWEDKKNIAVWRGALTGMKVPELKIPNLTREECRKSARCRFCYDYSGSSIVDAGLVRRNAPKQVKVDEIVLNRRTMSKEELLEYKMIVSIEGNDVSSGLKWQLLSNSVVLMAPPTRVSWAMEELLLPWVHYVPLNSDFSNVPEMVEWVIAHDSQAKQVAERATLFMSDMLYHPDAAKDDRLIKEEILLRYQKFLSHRNDDTSI